MLILTQNGNQIINFNDFSKVEIEIIDVDDYQLFVVKYTGKHKVKCDFLGRYYTLNDAKAVLNIILLNYHKMQRVLIMPKSNDIPAKYSDVKFYSTNGIDD